MKHLQSFESFLYEGTGKQFNESLEYIGPFVISDNLSDDELKKLHADAIEGYASWQKGFYYKKDDYKKAYIALEKIAKQRGINL